jgi:hypothetical protein
MAYACILTILSTKIKCHPSEQLIKMMQVLKFQWPHQDTALQAWWIQMLCLSSTNAIGSIKWGTTHLTISFYWPVIQLRSWICISSRVCHPPHRWPYLTSYLVSLIPIPISKKVKTRPQETWISINKSWRTRLTKWSKINWSKGMSWRTQLWP